MVAGGGECVAVRALCCTRAQVEELVRQRRIPSTVGGITLEQILLNSSDAARSASQRGQAMRYQLIKMDGDGPEGAWMRELQRLIARRAVAVEAMIVEGSHLSPAMMASFQRECGYTMYRLDDHDGRRFITAKGWDAYSPRGTIGRLDRLGALPRDALEEELFSVRGMRHVFRARANASVEEWKVLLEPVNRYPPQWVLTLESELLEPAFQSSTYKRSRYYQATNQSGRAHEGLDQD